MTTRRRPRYASKKRVGAFKAVLTESIALGETMIQLTSTKATAHLSRAYLAAALEAARGVLSEIESGRPTNAIRLARHIYEYELHLEYVLDRPGERLLQLQADDASRRILANRLVPELKLRRRTVGAYQAIVDASSLAAKNRGWRKKKGSPEKGPTLPTMEAMAKLLDDRQPGRGWLYDLVYRGASVLSHPGLLSADTYVEATVDGSAAIRDSTEDPIREVQALLTACLTLINLLGTTNWQLGATFGEQTRSLADRVASA